MTDPLHIEVPIHPIDLRRTLALQAFGAFDPTASWSPRGPSALESSPQDMFSKHFVAPSGICSVSIAHTGGGLFLTAQGTDADSILSQLRAAITLDDGYAKFMPAHPKLAELRRILPGLRLIRVPWLYDIACSAVLQQRVKSTDAMRDWRRIATTLGQRTPDGAVTFPSADALAATPLHTLQSFGVDPQRARTLIALARELRLNPLKWTMTLAQLRLRLSRIPGIGPWTVEMILGFGAADTDAVPTGDLYLPNLVAHALAGERRGTDERMLELLEPYRPHRFRVVRMLYAANITVPGWQSK